MAQTSHIISPVNSEIYKTISLLSMEDAASAVTSAKIAQKEWKLLSIQDRKTYVLKFIDALIADKEDIATELTWCIGRPRKYNFNEVNGFEERARHLVDIAESSLADEYPAVKVGFKRYIKHEPLGVVFIISAWNYPYLISVNGIIPALLAGNSVILKHAPQTFPVGDRFNSAFAKAGLPSGVFQSLCVDIPVAQTIIQHPDVSYVHFTGSVRGGHEVSKAAASRFIGVGLELGGTDAAYVRHDADPVNTAENLIDGAMYNSGQSCCGIQRIYVHESIHDQFVEACAKVANQYILGDPFDEATSLGPVVNAEAADAIRDVVSNAVELGGMSLIQESQFLASVV